MVGQSDMKTISLTDEEAYMLACIMGYVRYTSKVRTLLDKVDSLTDREMNCEDYDRVSVQVDIQKSQVVETTIEFN